MPQRPSSVRLAAAGFSDWIPLNRMSDSFGVGLGVEFSSNSNLTAGVQHTFDDIYERIFCELARVTTSLTVHRVNHGLSVDDWVKLEASPGGIWDAEYAVASVTDQDNFVVTVANSGASSGQAWEKQGRVFPHTVLSGLTARADSNYSQPPRACRLVVDPYVAGYVDLSVVPGGK